MLPTSTEFSATSIASWPIQLPIEPTRGIPTRTARHGLSTNVDNLPQRPDAQK